MDLLARNKNICWAITAWLQTGPDGFKALALYINRPVACKQKYFYKELINYDVMFGCYVCSLKYIGVYGET